MIKTYSSQKILIALAGVTLIFLFCTLLTYTNVYLENSRTFSPLISFDLLITTPLFYYYFIRYTKISSKTSILVLLLGIGIGTFILPPNEQQYLQLTKKWGIPLIELSILVLVIFKIVHALKQYNKKKNHNPDFYTIIKEISQKILPVRISNLVSTEISLFYYGFLSWNTIAPEKNKYSCHKKSGTIATMSAFIFLIFIEAGMFHLLIALWSKTIAWILTGLSLYAVIIFWGILRSIIKRQTLIEGDHLILRYGILSESVIKIDEIKRITLSKNGLNANDSLSRQLSPLNFIEGYNIILDLKSEHQIYGMYGFKKKFKTIALNLDDTERFKNEIEVRKNKL